jgi:hypothetical protein
MSKFSRRAFMSRTISVAATQALSGPAWALSFEKKMGSSAKADSFNNLDVSIAWDKVVSSIPGDMLGPSYESSQLAAPDFFSAANTELIALFRKLSSNGVLRLGGNLSEYTVWTPDDPHSAPRVPF